MKKISSVISSTLFILTILFVTSLLFGSIAFALPPQWGKEHGNRPADVFSSDKTFCLGQAIVKFDYALTNSYHPDGKPVTTGNSDLDNFFAKYDVYFVRNLTPLAKAPVNGNIDCRWLYWLQYPTEIPVEKFLTEIRKVPGVVTAGKNGLWEPAETPNDPDYYQEWHIDTLHCVSAWDCTHGDSTVIISICDMGTDVLHQDLAPNIWINPGEDINHDGQITSADSNNIDNDANNYTDDFYGWDFTDNDNNVQDRQYWAAGFGHGTHVAGCASARTNNGIGVASPGSKVRLMICRISVDDTARYLSYAFASTAWDYSLAMGAKMTNNSYGAFAGSGDPNMQNQITACFNAGMLMFCAAGNNNYDSSFYPAYYNNTASVAASAIGDVRASFSNYGNWVKITAPGNNILSTIFDGTHHSFGFGSGTSMASPTAAGCMALLWSVMPGASNVAVRDTLFHTAKNIDALNTTIGPNKLGWGRIDLGKAVHTQFPADSLTFFAVRDTLNGTHNGRAEPGDTVCIDFTVHNNAGHLGGQNVYYKLIITDTTLIPIVDSVYIGNRAVNSNAGSNHLKFFVPLNTRPHRTSLQIVTGGNSTHNLPFKSVISKQTITIGFIRLLIVDDDLTNQFDSFYESALDSINEAWEDWSVPTLGVPDTTVLTNYDDVFWFTGNRMSNVLNQSEQNALIWLQQHGKHLLFSSQGAGTDLGTSAFHQQWLHSTYSGTVSDRRLLGVSGDMLGDGMNLYLNGAGGGGASNTQSANILTPATEAVTGWNYNITGSSGVVYVQTDGHLNFVYCGFPVESINLFGSYVHRSVFFQRVLDLFHGTSSVTEPPATVLPHSYALNTPYPNPFNPTTTITYSIPSSGRVKLAVYDITGRLVTNLFDGIQHPGNYSVKWNAASVATGLYFIRLEGGKTTLTQKAMLVK